MSAQTYQQLIVEGIRDLPAETLAEITDFIYFVRKRMLDQHQFEEELKKLSRAEITHMEKEFEGYEQRYRHYGSCFMARTTKIQPNSTCHL